MNQPNLKEALILILQKVPVAFNVQFQAHDRKYHITKSGTSCMVALIILSVMAESNLPKKPFHGE